MYKIIKTKMLTDKIFLMGVKTYLCGKILLTRVICNCNAERERIP